MDDDATEIRQLGQEVLGSVKEAEARRQEFIRAYQAFVASLCGVIDEAIAAIEADEPEKAAEFLRAVQRIWGGRRALH